MGKYIFLTKVIFLVQSYIDDSDSMDLMAEIENVFNEYKGGIND